MCCLRLSRMVFILLAASLVLQFGITSGEYQGIQEVPETVPASAKGRREMPLQKEPVKRPAYVSGPFSQNSNPSSVTDNTSSVTRREHKLNQPDSKIVAASTSSVDEELAVISSNSPTSPRFQLDPAKKRIRKKFTDQRLSETDKIDHHLSSHEANNNNLPQAGFNYFKLQKNYKGVIGKSILRNETKENKMPSFNYISLRRCKGNSRWKGGRQRADDLRDRKLIQETGNTGRNQAARIEDKRQLGVICPQDQGSVLNPKGSFSGSTQDDTFPKIFGSRLYINRNGYIPESKTHMNRAGGLSRIKRGFHFGYSDEEVIAIPQTASDADGARSILEPTPVVKSTRPYLINPSFDSLSLKELANLKFRILSERLLLASPELDLLGEYQLDKPHFETIGINNFLPLLQKIRRKPSALLSFITNLGNDHRELHWSQKQFGRHDFNFPNTEYFPEEHPVQIFKRNFDPIGEGMMTGMRQNHVGKRYSGLFSTGNMDFDQVGVDLKPDVTPITRLDTLENGLDNSQPGDSFQDSDINYRYGSGTDSASNSYVGQKQRNKGPTNNFDSVNKWTVSAMGQRFTGKNEMSYITGTPSRGGNFPEKRLDAISNGALGGLRQNFLDKKHVQSHSLGSLTESLRDFLPNKYSHETGSKVKGDYSPNFASKTSFKKFTPQRIRWLNKIYDNDKKLSLSYSNGHSKSKPSSFKKRNNALIFSSPADQINRKFLQSVEIHDKRVFDLISSSAMSGLRQNYIGQNSVGSNKALTRLNDVYFSLLAKRKFPSEGSHFVDGVRNVDINLPAGLKSDEQVRFTNKRGPATFDSVRHTSLDDEEIDNVRHTSLDDEEIDYQKLYVDSANRIGHLRSLNRSQTSHPADKRAPFYTNFAQVEPEVGPRSLPSAPANGRSEENTSYLSNKYPEKRSFDDIDNFSPFSGLARNFIETTKQQRIGSLPLSSFTKRRWEVYSPVVHEREDTDDDSNHYLDFTLPDVNPSAEVDKPQGYAKKALLSDRTRLNSFLNKIHEIQENLLNDLHTKGNVYTFNEDGETLSDFRDRFENHNSDNQHNDLQINWNQKKRPTTQAMDRGNNRVHGNLDI